MAFHCATSGQGFKKGDPGVYRGALIDYEGYYDVCHNSAVQLGKLAGLVDPDEADRLQAEVDSLEAQVGALKEELATAAEVVRRLTTTRPEFTGEELIG